MFRSCLLNRGFVLWLCVLLWFCGRFLLRFNTLHRSLGWLFVWSVKAVWLVEAVLCLWANFLVSKRVSDELSEWLVPLLLCSDARLLLHGCVWNVLCTLLRV